MAVTVLDSKDLITHLTTGETPVPPAVAEDNARQKAAAEKSNGKSSVDPKTNGTGAGKDGAGDKSADNTQQEAAATGLKREDFHTESAFRTAVWQAQKPQREAFETDEEFEAAEEKWILKGVKTNDVAKVIAKKHTRIKEAEEFAADQYNNRRLAEQRAAELEAELAKLRQPVAKAEEKKEPKREEFQTDSEYAEALVDYKVEQKLRQKQAEEAKQRAEAEQAAIVQAAQERLQKAAELVPDFEETIDTDLNVPGHIAAYMQRSPLFAELGYHFAKHPEVLAELRKLTPAEALVEVGVIKSTLKPFSETHKGTEKASNGPEPSKTNGATPSTQTGESPSKPRGTAPVITPLSAGSTAQVEKDPREMNIRETIADWQKKNQRNLGLRKRH